MEYLLISVWKNVVGCKWVFTIKYNSDGTIKRYKVRLVGKGFTQEKGVDFNETLSHVAKLTSVKLMLGLAAKQGWELSRMDVSNAFLHSELEEEIYMSLPQGYTPGPNEILPPNSIARTSKGIYVCQRKYALDLLEDAGPLTCKPSTVPMDPYVYLSKDTGMPLDSVKPYGELIGHLYISPSPDQISHLLFIA